MAVTLSGRSIVMTAAADVVNAPAKVLAVRFTGTGLTAGQRLILKGRGGPSGPVIADHYVIGANEDQTIWGPFGKGCWIDRPYLDTVPAAGTWSLTFQLI